MEKNSKKIVIIIVIAVGLLIYFLPNIYKFSSSLNSKKVTGTKHLDNQKTTEKITLNSDTIKELVFPNLNNNIYTTDNYFKNSTFTIQDLSNNDILAFAFTQIYDGYFNDTDKQGCATIGKSISTKYIDYRIKNSISKNINYNYIDFNVSNSEYAGLWKYNGIDTYIYNGNCNPSNILYYDLQTIIEVNSKDNNNELDLITKVAFAKVENNHYTIYSDPNYMNEINTGVYTNIDDLNNIIKNLNTKKYQYVFKKGLCSYEGYCIEKGAWINE